MNEPELHYSWATQLRPHSLLRECTPYNRSGGFRAPVEIVLFPKGKEPPGFNLLSSRDYLETGADLDRDAAAVRFNADTTDAFSVIWVPESVPGDPDAVGRVHVIGPSGVTSIMRDMIEKSATPKVKRRVESVIEGRTELNGEEVPSTLRQGRTEAGLVRSISIPPGRLRLVSRLGEELLRPGGAIAHELVIGATVPDAVNETGSLECEIAVFPKGWVTLSGDNLDPTDEAIMHSVPVSWGRPQGGRTGAGSRYVFESLVVRSELVLASKPPPSRRPPSGRRGAEVLARLLHRGTEVCRLHHPFSIEPPEQALGSRTAPSPFAEVLQQVIDLARLSDVDVARATGAPVEAVHAWLADLREPGGAEVERVNELAAIVDRLAGVVVPDVIPLWLRRPLRVLDDEKPLDVLARGDYARISRIVAGLESPVAS